MINDRQIMIATAGSRKATRWPTSTLMWSELTERLKRPLVSTETHEEYIRLSKSQQDELKDVGGFVGGTFVDDRRKATNVVGRDVLALDLDNLPANSTQSILQKLTSLGCGYCVYSTRKHHPAAPRLRVLFPFDRTVTSDEYEPIGRKVAELAGVLPYADPTTFEPSRLMYWGSCCADAEYIYRCEDKPFLSADGILQMFSWQDISSWPRVPGETEKQQKRATVQKNPLEKQGIVGAFCRVYDIASAIDTYLAEQYEPDIRYPGLRYTYTGGSTTGGAVVYDGVFLYSHHATDPASGLLLNSFDLVRLHYFGGQDDEAKPDTPTNRLPSYTAMCELAREDAKVAKLLAQERYEQALDAFADSSGATQDRVTEEINLDWMQELRVTKSGQIASTINNIYIILKNDPQLTKKIAFDEFSNRGLALGALPWDSRDIRRDWADADDAGLRQYLEKVYEISGASKIADALTNVAMENKFNDVKKYLDSLEWDGIKRIDTLLIDYFGADDTEYTRAITRKFLCAAVARVYRPGTKFDQMIILSGPQGCGKSTFLARLGKDWYTDSLTTFEGKEAAEIIQGKLMVEVGELNAMNRSEINNIKQFLSRLDDVYREPYGRRTGRYPRRCVFAGTTNDTEFLRDRTGNRRFWPVDLHPTEKTKQKLFTGFTAEIAGQVWAETAVAWRLGERLYLNAELDTLAREQQEAHMESSPLEGPIREFLDQKILPNWDSVDLQGRRMFYASGPGPGTLETDLVHRNRICVAEIWVECLGKELTWLSRKESQEITGILSNMKGWTRSKSGLQFGKNYGYQKAFIRSKIPETNETN